MTNPNPMTLHEYVRANPLPTVLDAEALVWCPTCRQERPVTQFYLQRSRDRHAEGRLRGGRRTCRDCASATATAYRAPRHAITDAAVASGCVDCGLVDLDHPEVFDFDHIREGKVKSVSKWLTSGTVQDLLDEIARCEVVCSNCHRIRTRQRVSGKRGRDTGAYKPRTIPTDPKD